MRIFSIFQQQDYNQSMKVVIVFVVVLVVFFLASLIVFLIIFYSPMKNQNDDFVFPKALHIKEMPEEIKGAIKELNHINFENVVVEAKDKVILHAQMYVQDFSKPVIILFHGYRGTPFRDFNEQILYLMKRGYNLLIVNQRAHLNSNTHITTLGIKEKYDGMLWVDFALNYFGKNCKMILFGLSMGASTVLFMTTIGIPKNVVGIIADSPYLSFEEIIKYTSKTRHFPPRIIYLLALVGAYLFGHFRLNDVNVPKALQTTETNILILHGLSDRIVPAYMTESLSKISNKKIKRVTFEGAEHCSAFFTNKQKYNEELEVFLHKTLQ